jgi:flagellar motor switch protein FliM
MSETEDLSAEDAAGWGETPAEGAEIPATRVLTQTEIDGLMGFDDAPDVDEQQTGLGKIVNAGMTSYERLPMLDVVFDRLVRILSTSLRHLTSDNVEVSIDKITTVRFGDFMNSIPLPAMLFVFEAEQWDNYGLMVIDTPMIYSVVEVLLGGRKGTSPIRVEGRPYTTIERSLVEKMAVRILADLSTSFDPVCPVTFRLDRIEVNPRFAAISRTSNAAVVIKMRLEMDGRGGCFEIILPSATLEPIRDLLLQQFMGEKFGRDNIWESHLAAELRETDVELEVVLGEQPMNLSEMLALKVGSKIIFHLAADDPVLLRCGGVPLFVGRTGNRRNRVAVQIESKLRNEGSPQGAQIV